MVRQLNLDGDQQADLSVHGGPDKAVYAYPSEHYAAWRKELPDGRTSRGGRSAKTSPRKGCWKATCGSADKLRIGTTEFIVTQPRMPCYKLAAKFQRADMLKRLLRSGRTGFYLRVTKEGSLTAGDPIERTPAEPGAITVAEVVNLYTWDADNRELLERAVKNAILPEAWRAHFRTRLWDADE